MRRTTALTSGIEKCLQALKDEGKIKVLGTSIHDRVRAGQLARDSILDALMIRYNAKHPGAELDIFPHLQARDPIIMSYTATSWGQLLRPISGIEMPPWPVPGETPAPPPLTAELCYRFCLSSPSVHVTWMAPKTREQLDANLAALRLGSLPTDEEAWVRAYGRQVKARKKLPFI